MIKKPLHYIKVILAAVMLCSVFFAYAQQETNQFYSDQKEIILEKAQDDTKTIWELKDNIKQLNEEKEDIDIRITDLKESSDLGAFFKDTLSDAEITEVTEIVRQYRIINTKINKQLLETAEDFKSTQPIKQELLEQRKNVYKDLVPYIKIDKLDEYTAYIAWDASYLIEKKEVDADIARKQEVIEQKVEKIEEKIEENKKTLDEKIRTGVAERVDQYFNKLLEKEKFRILSLDDKVKIIDTLIERLESKIEEIKQNWFNSISIQQKIDILETVVLEKFIEFKNKLD